MRNLSRELARLGHQVEVFSGQPYPELDDGVALTRVASLDLYPKPDPFRTPELHEFRDLTDVLGVRHHGRRRVPGAADVQPAGRPADAETRPPCLIGSGDRSTTMTSVAGPSGRSP